MMNRRVFLIAVTAGALGFPTVGAAQDTSKVSRLGVLTTTPRSREASHHQALVQELSDLGYPEGKNLIIEWRHTGGEPERRKREVAEVVRWKPDVIIVVGSDAFVVREADASLPIVVAGGPDLVARGLAVSLRKPGGNVTGLEILSLEIIGKHLELMKELLPRLSRVAMLHARVPEANRYFDDLFAQFETASRALSIEALRFAVGTGDDLDNAFAEMRARAAQAVIVPASALMFANAGRLSTLASRHRLPDMYEISAHVEKGGLISYGYDYKDIFRRSAGYVARILKGAKPADLPIEQAAEFDLALNLKTAKVLGLTIPQSVLIRANRVIQ